MPKKRKKTKVKKKAPRKKSKKVSKKKNKKVSKKKNKKRINISNDSAELVIKTKPEWIKASLANKSAYQKKYNESIKNNNDFWKKAGKRITWIKPYKKIKDVKYSTKEVRIKWYQDGSLNASANCIDRHLKDKKDKTAIIWVEMIQKIVKKFHINNYTKKYLRRQMV